MNEQNINAPSCEHRSIFEHSGLEAAGEPEVSVASSIPTKLKEWIKSWSLTGYTDISMEDL